MNGASPAKDPEETAPPEWTEQDHAEYMDYPFGD